eukprot:2189825-Pyramimonas_sp.AAC.1
MEREGEASPSLSSASLSPPSVSRPLSSLLGFPPSWAYGVLAGIVGPMASIGPYRSSGPVWVRIGPMVV